MNWKELINLIIQVGILSVVVQNILASRSERKKFIFEKLHTERAEVIKELYQRMVLVTRSFVALMNPSQWKEAKTPLTSEASSRAHERLTEASSYLGLNELYFSRQLVDKLHAIFFELLQLLTKYEKDRDADYREIWLKFVHNKIPPAMAEIEKEFRDIIGVK